MKTLTDGATEEERLFASAQEAMGKDVEREFGVLVARFQILARPSQFWYRKDIESVMNASTIMRYMVVEARRDSFESGIGAHGLARDAQNLF